MPLHPAARLHAFIHGLFRPSDYTLTRELYRKVEQLLKHYGLDSESGRSDFIEQLADDVLDAFGLPPDHAQRQPVTRFLERIIDYESMFTLPRVDWSEQHSVTEFWEIRDELNEQRHILKDFDVTYDILRSCVVLCLEPIYGACPSLLDATDTKNGIALETDLIHCIGEPGSVAEAIIAAFLDEDVEKAELFARHRWRLEKNLILASGGNPDDPKGFNRAVKWPSKSDIKSPPELVDAYLGGTPIADFLGQKIELTIPSRTRMEHHWIVAPPGAGKSTLLQYLLLQDFERVARNEASVIVIDSNRDLAKSIERLKCFGSGGVLDGRLIVIDCEDVEYPVALNIFDIQSSDVEGLSPRDHEALYNSTVSMLSYIFHALLGAEMTSRQSTLFTFTIELLLALPAPTLDTLIDLMQPDGLSAHQGYISSLSPDAQRFFGLKFNSKEFLQTKSQVVDRLFAIKRIRTLSRMFSSPETKLNLFDELSSAMVIVINAAKSVLQEDGVEVFTRFFLANILLAAEKRQLIPQAKRLPTYLYIDECQDVIRRDQRLPVVLDQARKLRLGCVLAHQRLGQMTPPVLNALLGSTAIKFAANLADPNLSPIARSMQTTPEFLEKQPPFHFAAHIRGTTETALPLTVPHVDFATMEQMTEGDYCELRERMRERYAVDVSPEGSDDRPDRPSEPPQERDLDNPPTAPSSEW